MLFCLGDINPPGTMAGTKDMIVEYSLFTHEHSTCWSQPALITNHGDSLRVQNTKFWQAVLVTQLSVPTGDREA